MKSFLQQILMFGGVYFITSLLVSFFETLSMVLFFLFIVLLIALCIKKKFVFIEKLQTKFPKTSNYLLAFGMVEYINLIFTFIPGVIYGYKSANAMYNNEEYASNIPLYLEYFSFVHLGLLFCALLWATYKSVKKTNN